MSTPAAYFRERFPVRLFGPVCVLLTAAAAWSATSVTPTHLAAALLFGIILVVQFRLWDDLEDRQRDRVTHPLRVLVSAAEEPFRILLVVLMLASAALSAQQPAALAATLALDGAFWGAYRLARPRISANGWRFGLLLLKYPAFVAAIALFLGDVIPARLALAAAMSYLCASGYELLHDSPARLGGAS
jgi:Ni/Fe-hydrogenase subunit HybB-like protein